MSIEANKEVARRYFEEFITARPGQHNQERGRCRSPVRNDRNGSTTAIGPGRDERPGWVGSSPPGAHRQCLA